MHMQHTGLRLLKSSAIHCGTLHHSPENPARVHLAPRSKSRRLRTAGFATGEHPFGKAAVASCTALCATHKTFRNRNGLMATGNHWVTAETCFRNTPSPVRTPGHDKMSRRRWLCHLEGGNSLKAELATRLVLESW